MAVALVPTPLGFFGLAWSSRGLLATALPERSEAKTRAALLARAPEALVDGGVPPAWVRALVRAVLGHLDGAPERFDDVPLVFDGLPPFRQAVYGATRAIPPGATRTYGELAEALGRPGASRAVGQALAHNPFPLLVPCHRVVPAGGGREESRLGGFTAPGGVTTKRRLLALEGARAAEPYATPLLDAVAPSPLDAAVRAVLAEAPALVPRLAGVGTILYRPALLEDRPPRPVLVFAEHLLRRRAGGFPGGRGRYVRLANLARARRPDAPLEEALAGLGPEDFLRVGAPVELLPRLHSLLVADRLARIPTPAQLAALPDDVATQRVADESGLPPSTVAWALLADFGRLNAFPAHARWLRAAWPLLGTALRTAPASVAALRAAVAPFAPYRGAVALLLQRLVASGRVDAEDPRLTAGRGAVTLPAGAAAARKDKP